MNSRHYNNDIKDVVWLLEISFNGPGRKEQFLHLFIFMSAPRKLILNSLFHLLTRYLLN